MKPHRHTEEFERHWSDHSNVRKNRIDSALMTALLAVTAFGAIALAVQIAATLGALNEVLPEISAPPVAK